MGRKRALPDPIRPYDCCRCREIDSMIMVEHYRLQPMFGGGLGTMVVWRYECNKCSAKVGNSRTITISDLNFVGEVIWRYPVRGADRQGEEE